MNLAERYMKGSRFYWIESIKDYWHPDDAQKHILHDKSQYRALYGTRQIGKTNIIVIDSLGNAINKEKSTSIILVPYARNISSLMDAFLRMIQHIPSIKDLCGKISNDRIVFSNGSVIKIQTYNWPGMMDSCRRCNYLYMDDAFYMEDPIDMALSCFMASRPEVSILIAGTPHIAEARNKIDKHFVIHKITMKDSPWMVNDMINTFYDMMEFPVIDDRIITWTH